MISTFIYMIYFCDKTKRRLPRIFRKLVASTNYALTDRRLNDTLTSTGTHLSSHCKLQIKDELIAINRQLDELERKYQKLVQQRSQHQQHSDGDDLASLEHADPLLLAAKVHFVSIDTSKNTMPSTSKGLLNAAATTRPRTKTSSIDSLVASNMLGFLADFKRFVKKHNMNVRRAEVELVDLELQLDMSEYRLGNFRFISTLETFKHMILNPAKGVARARRHEARKLQHKLVDLQQRGYASHNDLTHRSPAPSPRCMAYAPPNSFYSTTSLAASAKFETAEPKFGRLLAVRDEQRRAHAFLDTLVSYNAQLRGYLDLTSDVDFDAPGYLAKLASVPPGLLATDSSTSIGTADSATPAAAFIGLDSHDKIVHRQFEWRYLGLVFDRVFFFFYSVLIPICIIVMYAKTVLLT
jgi:hypothetical protein